MVILFGGQAAQTAHMGDKWKTYPQFSSILSKLEVITDVNLSYLLLDATEEELKGTFETQLSIFALQMIEFEIYKKNFSIEEDTIFAGHSLGEVMAYYASGVLSFEDSVKVAKARAKSVDQNLPKDTSMYVEIGLSKEDLLPLLKDTSIVLANYNGYVQCVLSGQTKELENKIELLKEKGAKRVLPLKIAAAFHSPFMKDAKKAFEKSIKDIPFQKENYPLFLNKTAMSTKKTDNLKEILINQLVSPVNFVEMIENISKEDHIYLEIGEKKVLSSLVKRLDKDAKVEDIYQKLNI